MGALKNHQNPTFLFFLSLPILLLLLQIPTQTSSSDTTTLIYKGCADQKLQDPSGAASQNLKTLLNALVTQSSQKNFAATTSGDGGNSAVAGAYQCRGDLTNSDCYDCVSKIPNMLGKLCGGDVAAARIQLSGCYLRYEVVGFKEVPKTQLLYKVCGSKKMKNGGDVVGFEGKRDSAFQMVENGVKGNNGNLFYTGSYESLYVLGQCEGNMGNDDCGDCIASAEEQVKVQCGDSISAQVYLQGCYLSYSFYPNGVPGTISSSSSSPGEVNYFPPLIKLRCLCH
ncbi:plasmodesmata-located protein 1 isoform X2 [Arachis hypogaea]|uniref:plasmodesmata-located protein 1 isoform X2 n=1 Tax=Arachis hypogaea TaxID=3818 RepID=UPI0034E78FC0